MSIGIGRLFQTVQGGISTRWRNSAIAGTIARPAVLLPRSRQTQFRTESLVQTLQPDRPHQQRFTDALDSDNPMCNNQPALKTMDLPSTLEFLHEIERRQDEVLRELDALDAQVALTLRQCLTDLKLVRPSDEKAA
jgi:hypothetical protein